MANIDDISALEKPPLVDASLREVVQYDLWNHYVTDPSGTCLSVSVPGVERNDVGALFGHRSIGQLYALILVHTSNSDTPTRIIFTLEAVSPSGSPDGGAVGKHTCIRFNILVSFALTILLGGSSISEDTGIETSDLDVC
ncbi:hypothetical protein M407DRAFT_219046 [Tulasnella calospora MUT 4182]|uniref:Uncharacterized protein n=1 Tax=Tulasnella calospora MUT 4182 TaxID=1051891 RepID=A0A0C3Q9F8_9AGAM|nr:hypothetical protein M407DRAFT_219046 [Tulasnella calospora MUT 4182]